MRKTVKNSKRKKWILLGIIVAIVACFALLELTNTTHIINKGPTVSTLSEPISSLPSNPAANNGEKKIASSSSVSKTTGDDKDGQVPKNLDVSDQSKWTVSQSGAITLKSPASNSSFKSGGVIFGSSKLSQVQYRLIDNQVGVISQGTIKVVNGNFTAEVSFKNYSSSGRLDMFSADQDGIESNSVQVPINF